MQALAASSAPLQGQDVAQLRNVMDSCTRAKGPYHPDTIQATSDLMSWLLDHHQPAAALPLAQRLLESHQRMLGSTDHLDLLKHIVNLSTCQQRVGRYGEGEGLLIRALDIVQRERGPEDPNTIEFVGHLALCQKRMGKFPAAESLYRRVVDFNERLLGQQHPQTIRSIKELGMLLIEAGQVQEGEPMLHQALGLFIRALGLRHPETIKSMIVLGTALSAPGRPDYVQAERLLRRGLELSTDVIGPDDPMTIGARLNVVSVLWLTGQRAEAFELARTCLEACTRVLGPAHEFTITATQMVQQFAPLVASTRNRAGRGRGGGSSRTRR